MKILIKNGANALMKNIALDSEPGIFKRVFGQVLMSTCYAILYNENPRKAFYRAFMRNRKAIRFSFLMTLVVVTFFSAGMATRMGMYEAIALEKAKISKMLGLTRASLKGTEAEKDMYMQKLDNILKHKDYMRFVILKDADIFVPESVPQEDLKKMFSAADEYRIPYRIYFRLVYKESLFNPKAISPKGAVGYTQIMPEYMSTFLKRVGDKKDWVTNCSRITGFLLRNMYNQYYSSGHDEEEAWRLSLAAYNAGAGAVEAHGGIPPYEETLNYVKFICAK